MKRNVSMNIQDVCRPPLRYNENQHSVRVINTGISSSGFSLIEAVLALAILGIGIFILIGTTARCLAVIRVARNYQIARSVLDQGELDYPLQTTNDVEKNAVDPIEYVDGFTFSREITPVDGEEHLFIVKTKVTWSETGKASFEEVTSCLYSTEHD